MSNLETSYPNFEAEMEYQGLVAGLDEVGRGAWAGPVYSCAVIFPTKTLPPYLHTQVRDSKKLTPKKRQILAPILRENCIWAMGIASVQEIDQLNILQSSLLSMRRAFTALPTRAHYALIDGNHSPDLNVPTKTIIKGDLKSFSIAASSILAKVARDQFMAQLALTHPHYGWETNAGYGVKAHQQGLKEKGITPWHRKSFKPIKALL